jgi:hypothetical protein
VVSQAIRAVQSQKVPAEQALRTAMGTLGAAQQSVVELMLSAAKAQAQMVEYLARGQSDPRLRSLGSEIGGLLVKAVERSPEFVDSLAAGLTQFLSSMSSPAPPSRTGKAGPPPRPPASAPTPVPASAPIQSQPGPQAEQTPDSAPPPSVTEPQPLTESQLLEAITGAIAEGYSAGRSGQAVAESIRVLYPAAIPTMQTYLAMDDFLVLMWMRQQPALAEIANNAQFPQFYAELKTAILNCQP